MKKTSAWSVLLLVVLSFGESHASPINLSQIGATATANQIYSNFLPGLAIDGIVSEESSWVAPDHGTSSDPNWLKIDLGNVFTVNQISLFSRDTSWENTFFVHFELHTSLDGSNWGSLLASGNLFDDPVDYYDDIFFSTPIDTRYIRVLQNAGSHWSNLAEIQVYGRPSVASTVPEPSTVLLLGCGLMGLVCSGRKRTRKVV